GGWPAFGWALTVGRKWLISGHFRRYRRVGAGETCREILRILLLLSLDINNKATRISPTKADAFTSSPAFWGLHSPAASQARWFAAAPTPGGLVALYSGGTPHASVAKARSAGLYARRTAGRDRHHRHVDRAVAPRCPSGARSGTAHVVQEQPAASR